MSTLHLGAGSTLHDHHTALIGKITMRYDVQDDGTIETMDGIEPARRQFVERTFSDLLGAGNESDAQREEWLRWAHDRLFLEGANVATVRMEWSDQIRQTQVIAVTSGKGGVGKTTFSVNLAVSLAARGAKVLLFDADLGMANVHVFAGVNPRTTLLDVVNRRASLQEAMIDGPGGIRIIAGASGVGRLADMTRVELETLGRDLQRAAADFDVLVLDTGAGISNGVMHFLGLAQEVIIVTTPNLAATLDAYGVIKTIYEQQLGAQLHLVINMAESDAQAARVQERIETCSQRFLQRGLSKLGVLLHDPAVERANQSRRPLALSQPDHENARRLAKMAAQLLETAAAV